jgi:hypothetical protein
MRYGGVPFLVHWTESEAKVEKAQGVRASAIAEWHSGNYAGALIGGLFSSVASANGDGGGHVAGMRIGGVISGNDGDLTGLSASGLYNYVMANVLNGVSLSWGANIVGGRLNGVSAGGCYNYAGSNGLLAVQIGAFNNLDRYEPDGTVVQIGWYNRAAEQSIPFLNVKGISNLFERPLRRLRGKDLAPVRT